MLIAAEMSVLELYDAQFRLECERMAASERKRPEKKNNNGVLLVPVKDRMRLVLGTRRSA